MNGLVSQLPNERAELGSLHPLTHVKCADHSTANRFARSSGGSENRSIGFSLDDTAVAQPSLSGLSGHHSRCFQWGVSTNSGLSPSARARTPNADVDSINDGVGTTKE
jgi:hypothetical protein